MRNQTKTKPIIHLLLAFSFSHLVSCQDVSWCTDTCDGCNPPTKRTLGQLLVSAHLSPGELVCVYGRIKEVANGDHDTCYTLIDEPKNFCTENFVKTGVMDPIDSPFWMEKGYCSSAGNVGTSGRNLLEGSTIASVVLKYEYSVTANRDGANEQIGIHGIVSPIFDVSSSGDVVIGGETTYVQVVEQLTVKFDEFVAASRNISAGHMLRYPEFCVGQYCSNACISHAAFANGQSGSTCSEGMDCYYGATCAQVYAEEPDYCEVCGESPPPQPEWPHSDRWVPDGGWPLG